MILFLSIFFIFLVIWFYLSNFSQLNKKKKVSKSKKFKTYNKNNLNNWMNLTKKERYKLTKEESISYMKKRKILLEEIRKEYKKISKENLDIT